MTILHRFTCMFLAVAASAVLVSHSPTFTLQKVVYLTFDDGPQKGTEDVLDILKAHNAPATFFVTGSNQQSLGGKDPAARQKELLQRILADGHAIGNHGFAHLPQTKKEYLAAYGELTMDSQKTAFKKNMDDNQQHFRTLLSTPTLSFALARLPGDGRTFPVYVKAIDGMGMKHVDWSFEFAPNGVFAWVPHKDWQGLNGVAASHAGTPPDKAIILFHDRHWAGGNRALLKSLITKLKEDGYTFAKVAQ